MRKILSIFSILLLLTSCFAATGDGTTQRLNTSLTSRDYPTIFLKYSSNPSTYGWPAKIKVNGGRLITIGDNEAVSVNVNEGPLVIDVFTSGTRVYPITFKKDLVKRNNNYYFIIKMEKTDFHISDVFKGQPTYVYKIFDTYESAFHNYESDQIGLVTKGEAVPTILGFSEKAFSRDRLNIINREENKFKEQENIKIQAAIFQSENECFKLGLKNQTKEFDDCKLNKWKSNYGKYYEDLRKEISVENQSINKLVNASDDQEIREINNARESSLRNLDDINDIATIALTIVASYYIGKAIGESLNSNKQLSSNTNSNISKSRDTGVRYICRLNYGGGGCGLGSGYGIIF